MKQDLPQKEKERYQYISFASIKANFHKLFGQSNDALAEMLFRYISDCRVDPRQKEYLNEVKQRDRTKQVAAGISQQVKSSSGKTSAAVDLNQMTINDEFETQNDIHKVRVNFYTFMLKLDPIWQKKPQPCDSKEPSVIEQHKNNILQQRLYEQNKLAFALFDLDGDQKLSILDLEWLRENFPINTNMGIYIKKLHDLYLEKNVKPKYVKQI